MSDHNPPPPPGWTKEFSRSQQKYYYFHTETGHRQWHPPTESEVKDVFKAIKRAEMEEAREKERQKAAEERKRAATKEVATTNKRAKTGDSNDLDFLDLADATCVAIIVPYRDLHAAQKRAAHLKQFVPHMHQFFDKLKRRGLVSDYHVYIVEQSKDGRKFNRGKLLNIGFDVARKSGRKHDVFIFHDVDLLPNDELGPWYAKMPAKPIHIARVWNRYSNNEKYFGGVISVSKSDFLRLNGYPNNFWGWGGEDDELKNRLDRNGITFDSPNAGSLQDLEGMDLKEKLQFLRDNRTWKCMTKWESLDEHATTWKVNGLADLKYKVLSNKFMDETNKASKVSTDILLNGSHWSNEKSGLEYMPDGVSQSK